MEGKGNRDLRPSGAGESHVALFLQDDPAVLDGLLQPVAGAPRHKGGVAFQVTHSSEPNECLADYARRVPGALAARNVRTSAARVVGFEMLHQPLCVESLGYRHKYLLREHRGLGGPVVNG